MGNPLLKKKKSWVITGGAGFIGSNLIEHLLQNNQNVICIDNLSTGYFKNISIYKNKNLMILR